MTSSNDGDTRGRLARAFGRLRGDTATTGSEPAAAAGISPTVLGAPATGTAVALAETEDPAFSAGILGPGAAVRPTVGDVVSPLSGTVVSAMPHAYGLRATSGLEVLVHVGVDTVGLDGLHFTPHVAQGQQVAAGEPLVSVDLDAVAAAGYPTTVILVVTNTAGRRVEPPTTGPVEAGQPLLTVAA